MHYHLEIIMPPVTDVEGAVKHILKPFDEQGEDEDGDPNRHGFWGWWVIGGRWAGTKLESALCPERKGEFFAELTRRKVTVSGFRVGKESLEPASQVPMVDGLWREFFPDSPLDACPFFAHFNDQYRNSDGFPDVMRLGDVPRTLAASRVIVAGPSRRDDGTLEAQYMTQDSFWNGVSHIDAGWDGKVCTAIEEHVKRLQNCKAEYAAKQTPKDDWLAVTVDYHS